MPQKFQYSVHKSLAVTRILSKTYPLHVVRFSLCKIIFIIILPFTPQSLELRITFRLCNKILMCTSVLRACHVPKTILIPC